MVVSCGVLTFQFVEKFWKTLFGCEITGLCIWLYCWYCTIVDASIASLSLVFWPISAMELDIALIAVSVDLLLSFIASWLAFSKPILLWLNQFAWYPFGVTTIFFLFISFGACNYPFYFLSLSYFTRWLILVTL